MSVQILEIAGHKMAVLPIEDYQRLLEVAEEREDIAAAEEAERQRAAGMEYLPASMVNRILDGENALRVWREYRGLSIAELGRTAGFGYSMIAKVESGDRQGTIGFWNAVAAALKVQPDDIMPVE